MAELDTPAENIAAEYTDQPHELVERIRPALWRELGDRVREDWPRSAHYWHKIYRLASESENPTAEYVPELTPCPTCAERQAEGDD